MLEVWLVGLSLYIGSFLGLAYTVSHIANQKFKDGYVLKFSPDKFKFICLIIVIIGLVPVLPIFNFILGTFLLFLGTIPGIVEEFLNNFLTNSED